MTGNDWMILANCIIALMAVAAFILSLVSFFRSNKLNSLQSEVARLQISFASGQTELTIRIMISDAKDKYLNCAKEYSEKGTTELKTILDAKLEDLLNAYDEACAKYIDGKIDKDRFKKMYSVEIRQLIENENTKVFYDTVATRFRATLKVYNEWNNLEN